MKKPNKPRYTPIDITEQQKSVQCKSDRLIGFKIITFDDFCNAIDALIHKDTMDYMGNTPIGNSRAVRKAIGEEIHNNSGQSYYEIYLDIKYQKQST